MIDNAPAANTGRTLESIPVYALMIALSPVFLILTLVYIYLHSDRVDEAAEEDFAGELAIMDR